MKRQVTVRATADFTYEIDDEAESSWDGSTILKVLESETRKAEGIYTDQATLADLLGHLGIQLCVDNRTMGTFDGWADFHESAASGSPFSVDWTIEDVYLDDDRVTT